MGIGQTILDSIFQYQTIKLVSIRNFKIALTYRLIQLVVFTYVVVFALYMRGGYQDSSAVIGDVSMKVKGMGFINQSGVMGPMALDDLVDAADEYDDGFSGHEWVPGDKVFDANDLVVPPLEPKSVFITTALHETQRQTRGVAVGNDPGTERCPCVVGQYTRNGFVASDKCQDNGYCLVSGWVPFEDDTEPDIVHGSGEFTVFARTTIRFPKYPEVVRTNANNTHNITTPTEGYNLFKVKSMVEATGTSWTDKIKSTGIVIGAFCRWECDLDYDVTECQPDWSFQRLDDPKKTFSSGMNFREVNKYYLPDTNGTGVTQYRDLTKRYGVRIMFIIDGEGRRFNIVALLTNLGAGIGLLAVASLVADLCLHVVRRREVYLESKFQQVEEPESERLPLLSGA
jgi:P2X purinoceptor 4